MRYAALAVIIVLSTVASVLPRPDDPVPGDPMGAAEQAAAVCPVQEGRGRSTDVAVLSSVSGPTQITLFTGGETAGSLGTSTGASGSTIIPVGDIAAVGTVGGLVELPDVASSAGVLVTGAASLMAETCLAAPSTQAYVVGGSTVSGESFSMQFMNPYAGEAIVSLRVTSEAGFESSERFDSMVIPPRSTRIVNFNQLIPGRESLSVGLETHLGRVIAVARQGALGEGTLWNAVEPAQDWFLPIPKGKPARTLLIGTPSAIDVDYQVDFYGAEGLEEGLISGTLPAGGQAEIDLDEISEETSAVRVVSTGPVVPTLRIESDRRLATTAASSRQANRWMLPAASPPPGGRASVVILNPSIEDATVTLRPLRENSTTRDLALASDGVVQVALERADGYLIESTSPIVVLWTARSEAGHTLAMGAPLDDG